MIGACTRKLPHETNGCAVQFLRDTLIIIRHIASTQDQNEAVVEINKLANKAISEYDHIQYRTN